MPDEGEREKTILRGKNCLSNGEIILPVLYCTEKATVKKHSC